MSQVAIYPIPGGSGFGTVTSVTGGTGINITGVSTVNPTVNLNVPVVIANGGTNATSFATTDGTVYFDGTRLVTTGVGTAGWVLTSNGAAAPTYQAVTASGAVTSVNAGANISITGTSTAPIVNVAGTTNHSVQVGTGSTGLTQIAVGATGTVLIGNSAADPSWSATPSVTSITIANAPVNPTDGTNKAYVDSVAAGFEFKSAVYAASTAPLTVSYFNGVAGVGATLTNTGANAIFSIDGTTPPINSRILIKDQSTTYQNGIYTLTVVGTSLIPWVLTRSTDYNTPAQIQPGDIVPVINGTVNATTLWLETATVTTIGVDPILFTQFSFGPSMFLQVANNLSDVASASTSRTNLGLTNVATQHVTQYDVLVGGSSDSITSIANGTTGQVLHAITGSNNPTWSAVDLTADVSGILPIANGGTNASSMATTDGTVYFDGTRLVTTAVGTSTWVLTSNGAGIAPTYQAVSASGAVTSVAAGTNISITGTATVPIVNVAGTTNHTVQLGTGATGLNSLANGTTGQVLHSITGANDPVWSAVSLTADVAGILPVPNGGTGANTLTGVLIGNGTGAVTGNAVTQYDVLVGGASNAITSVAPSATSGIPLISQGAASNPVFGTAVVAGGGTGNTTFNAYSLIAAGTTATGAFQNVSGTGTTGQILVATTGALPVWTNAGTASSISITGDTGDALVGSAFTFTGGTTGLSFGGSGSTETLTFAGITANAGVVNLGTDNAANAINIGLGTTARAIHIGDSAAAHVITIGSTTGVASITEHVGTGNYVLDGVTNSTFTIGASTTTGTITIGGTAETGTLTLGSSSGANTQIVAGGTGATTLQIANAQTAGSVTIGAAMTTGTIAIGGTGLQTGTITIGGGTGAQTVNLATGGTGIKTVHIADGAAANVVTLGSTTALSTTTIQGAAGITLSGIAAYAPICGGTSTTTPIQSATTGFSNSGYVLTSTGATSLPTWQVTGASSISITGNTGGALTGNAFTFSGGTTGLSFGGEGSTETLTFAGITANAGVVNLGTDSTANAINVGTVSNTGRVITIGNVTGTTGISELVGTGNYSLDGVTNSTYTVGASTTTGTITIGGTAQTGTMTLGSSSGTNIIAIGAGAGSTTVNVVNTQGGGAFNVGAGMTTGTITIGGTGLQTGTISIGTGTGAQILNFGTGGTGAKTVNIGSSASTGTTTIQSGSGGVKLQAVAEGALVTSSASVISTVTGTAGYVLTANAAGTAPSFQAPAAGGVSSITGTANQITASASTGAVTLSTPATFIAPGSIAATTTVTATLGNITATSGNFVLTASTTSTVGQITQAGAPILHTYGGVGNIFVGASAGNFTNSANYNTVVGASALMSVTSSGYNTAMGYFSLYSLTSGGAANNTSIGFASGTYLLTGKNNCFYGQSAGDDYNGSESSNICIGSNNYGVTGESNVLRIGNGTGTAVGNLNAAYISGVYGIANSGTLSMAIIDSNNQLGSVAGSFVSTTAWTPVLKFGGASVGITYGAQTGVYSIIGKMMMFQCLITLSSKGSSTGNATISGLPSTASAVYPITILPQSGLTFTAQLGGYAQNGTLVPEQFTVLGAASNITNTGFANTTSMYISGFVIFT